MSEEPVIGSIGVAAGAVWFLPLVQVVGMLLCISSLAVATLWTVIDSIEVCVVKLIWEGRSFVLLVKSDRFLDVVRVCLHFLPLLLAYGCLGFLVLGSGLFVIAELLTLPDFKVVPGLPCSSPLLNRRGFLLVTLIVMPEGNLAKLLINPRS